MYDMMARMTTPTANAGPSLTVVVPVGPTECAWPDVLFHLVALKDAEIVFVGTTREPSSFPGLCRQAGFHHLPRWVQDKPGRARQLNAGAGSARGSILWFLHADCRPSETCIETVSRLRSRPGTWLTWFRLRYLRDGPALTRLNAWGANVRSRLCRLPFGDQGLCMPASAFKRLGGFDDTLTLGEDLDLVVRARAAGTKMLELPCRLDTSARRYRGQWLTTTCRHIALTMRLTHEARLRIGKAAP